MKFNRVLVLTFLCCLGSFPAAAHISRQKKLSPLTPQQMEEAIQKIRETNRFECAFIFDLKTTFGKEIENKEGRFYSRKNGDVLDLRFHFSEGSFLFLGGLGGGIYCSEGSPPLQTDDPIQARHLLNFSDILMPFLGNKDYEYRCNRRVQGRNTHIIRFKMEKGKAIDIAYDPAFEAVLQIEYFDEREELMRIFKLLNFKKFQDIWLMKSVEIRNVPGKITTRLTIKKVATGTIPTAIFDKNSLGKDLRDRLIYGDF
ncbi:MAG: outer membrane lipoprotein-sorting protein [Puniceicoccales bacterium]|jgi:hypothetical protein|nr:outer membrane lipoprotein-sorting protein [Puniceicoccales bacterium]